MTSFAGLKQLHNFKKIKPSETLTVIDPNVLDEQIYAGYGGCKTCFLCGGFTPKKDDRSYCTCGHHFKNHNRA